MATAPDLAANIGDQLIAIHRTIWEDWQKAYDEATDKLVFLSLNGSHIVQARHQLRLMGVWLEFTF